MKTTDPVDAARIELAAANRIKVEYLRCRHCGVLEEIDLPRLASNRALRSRRSSSG